MVVFPSKFRLLSIQPAYFNYLNGIGSDSVERNQLYSGGVCRIRSDCTYVQADLALHSQRVLIDYFRLFIVATGCPSERRPQKTVSCYGG